jgi:hypothetical protein
MTEDPLDEWTAVHLGAGVLAGMIGFTPRSYLSIEITWEIIEEYALAPMGYFRESFRNKVFDVLIGTLGCTLGLVIALNLNIEPLFWRYRG